MENYKVWWVVREEKTDALKVEFESSFFSSAAPPNMLDPFFFLLFLRGKGSSLCLTGTGVAKSSTSTFFRCPSGG